MPDRTESQTTEQQGEQRSQSAFDTSFFEQMGGPAGVSPASLGWDVTSQVVQSYFEQADSQLRQARRMADLWAQSLILQQTTNEIAKVIAPSVTKQVISYLKQHPELVSEQTSK